MRTRTVAGAITAGLALILIQITPALAAPGDLDTTFSSDGMKKVDDAQGGEDVAIQKDGKIVAVGSDGERMVVARLNRDGSLDDTFSGDGILHVTFGNSGFSEARGVALVNGDIVVVGTHFPDDGDIKLAMARIDAFGDLDDSFSSDGKVQFGLSGDTRGADVAIQSNGRIVCVGQDGGDLLVVRFKSDGTPDPSFDGDGAVTTSFSEDVEGEAVAIDPNTQRIVAGAEKTPTGSTEDFVITRYTTTGALDPSWSGDGQRITSTTADGGLQSLTVMVDSSVIAVGSTESSTAGWQMLIRKFLPGGDDDGTWNDDGKVQAGFTSNGGKADDFANDVFVTGSDRVMVVGTSIDDGGRRFAVMRFTAPGHLDDTFSGDGALRTEFNKQSAALAVKVNRGTGKIVVVGNAINDDLSGDGMYLARYLG